MSNSEESGRPKLPADIRRRVLVEAGHRCAIPTCRYIQVEVHHIDPWSNSKSHSYENLIALCPNCHARADNGEIDRKSLRLYKSNLRFIHDKYSQLEIDVLFVLYSYSEGMGMPWFAYQLIFLKRALDSGFVRFHPAMAGVEVGGLMTSPGTVSITPEGRKFIGDLGLHEL